MQALQLTSVCCHCTLISFGATLTFQLSRFIYWDDCSNVSAFQKVKKYLLAFLMWPCIICMGVLLWQYIMIIAWCVRNRTYGEYKIPDVRLIVFYSLRNYIHGIAQMLKWELQRQILDSQEEQIPLWPVLKVPMWLMWFTSHHYVHGSTSLKT
mgnify:CR=1 FL=1